MNPASRTLRLLLVCGGLAGPLAGAQTIPVPANLWRLVAQEDTDGDRKITILDHTTPFELRDDAGVTVRVVAGEYPLSVLMQELKRAENSFH